MSRPSLNLSFSARSAFSLVVPEVTTSLRPLRSRSARDARAALRHQLGAGDEDHRRERDELAAVEIVGRRAAFEVDLAAGDRVDAVVRGHRLVGDLQRRPCNSRPISSTTPLQRSIE